jgi:hypothetical protein
MKIRCAQCGKEFSWEPPKEVITMRAAKPKEVYDVYAIACPFCKIQLRVTLRGGGDSGE